MGLNWKITASRLKSNPVANALLGELTRKGHRMQVLTRFE